MSRFFALETFRLCANVLEAKGYTVREEVANAPFLDEMAGINKNASRQMSRDSTDLTESNSFWLSLRKAGELKGVVAARLDVIDEGDAQAFIEKALRRYWCSPGADVKLTLPPSVRGMSGPIVYVGDLFFDERDTGDRAKTMCFMHCLHALAFTYWPSAGATYGFIRTEDYGPYIREYGFTSGAYYEISTWDPPIPYRGEGEIMLLLRRRDFLFNMGQLVNGRPEIFSEWPGQKSRWDYGATQKMHSQERALRLSKSISRHR